MPKTKISEWSSTPASNTDIDGINIAEGCAPSGINDAIREMMAQVKDLYSGTTGDAIGIAGGGTGATTASGARTNLGAQDILVSGTNIKTINSTSILGAGNLVVGVSDGDKGDITVSGSGATWTVDNGAITTAKIVDANVTGAKLENSGVTAGVYGSASAVPVVTVDAKGRVTSATTQAIASSAPTTAQVLSATAGATLGALGTYMAGSLTTPAQIAGIGDTRTSIFAGGNYQGAPNTYGGTWRVMGAYPSNVNWNTCDSYRTYLFFRIA